MRYLLICVFLTTTVLIACDSSSQPESSPASAPGTDPRIAQVEQGLLPRFLIAGESRPNWSLADRMLHHNVPGMSIAVMVDGEIVWAEGYGVRDAASGEPVDAETLFQAASLSKPVAGLGALKMVAQGRLAFDRPINETLKSWQVPPHDWSAESPLTLRHLLSHRGGTTIHGFRGYAHDAELPTTPQILAGEAPANTPAVVVNKRPGESYRYSGGGTTIMQLAMADAAGTDFPSLMDTLILEPAGLTRSTFAQQTDLNNAARAHVGEDSTPLEGHSYRHPEMAAAGLWTTPSELLRLSLLLTTSPDGAFLPTSVWEELIHSDEGYFVFGRNEPGDGEILVHGGANVGFRARWYTYADGRGAVAIMTNSDSGDALIQEVLSSVGEAFGWAQDAVSVRELVELSPSELATLLGSYTFAPEEHPAVEIRVDDDGKLWMDSPFGPPFRLYTSSSTELFALEGTEMRLDLTEDRPPTLVIQDELYLTKVEI